MQSYIPNVIPLSSSIWKNKVCTLIVFAGCNLRCPFCYVAPILDFKEEFQQDLRDVKRQIQDNAPFVDAILFCGGEPTLQRPALIMLAKYARELGLQIGLQTNGTKPSVLQELISQGLVDKVFFDLKAPLDVDLYQKATRPQTFFKPMEETLEEIQETIEILQLHQEVISVNVRTTIVPNLTYRMEHLHDIAHMLQGLECTWDLYPFLPTFTTVSQKYETITSPSKEFLLDLKKSCLSHYPLMNIVIHDPEESEEIEDLLPTPLE